MSTSADLKGGLRSLRDEVEYFRKCWKAMARHVSWQASLLADTMPTTTVVDFRDPDLPLELTFNEIRDSNRGIHLGPTSILNLAVVLVGKCTFHAGSEQIEVGTDEAFAVCPEEQCSIVLHESCERALVLRLQFHPDIVSARGDSVINSAYVRPFWMSGSARWRHVPQNAPESHEIVRDVWAIYDDLKSNDDMYRLHVHARLCNLLVALAEYHRRHDSRMNDEGREKLFRLRQVIQYLNENYNRKSNLATVSSIAMMSENYFCRFFKAATGSSFVQYVLRLRIDRAKDLLLHSSLPITDISSEVGFTNYNYFDRIFRRHTNVSPSRYRVERMTRPSGQSIHENHPLALSMSALDHIGWAAIYLGMIAARGEPNEELFTLCAGNSIDEQLAQVDEFIDEGAKVIILNPVDSTKGATAVVAANRAGIPVVCVDRSTEGGNVATLVESDNIACGAVAAQLMGSAARGDQLRVLVLQGDLATSAGVERNQGFLNALEGQSDISTQMVLPCYWDAGFAREAILYALERYPEINAIYVPSDNAYITAVVESLGRLNRLFPSGHSRHVVVVTVDGSPAALEQIRKGHVDAVAAQNLYGMGTMAMSKALRIAVSHRVDHSIIRIPPTPVTKENVETVAVWGNMIYRFAGSGQTHFPTL